MCLGNLFMSIFASHCYSAKFNCHDTLGGEDTFPSRNSCLLGLPVIWGSRKSVNDYGLVVLSVYQFVFVYLGGRTEIFDGHVTTQLNILHCEQVCRMDGVHAHFASFLYLVHTVELWPICNGQVDFVLFHLCQCCQWC